jgi:hypothetical protein
MLNEEPVSNRRAILLISQERDDGSKTPMKEIVRDLGETNTAIYSVTFSAQKTEAKLDLKYPHLNPPIAVIASDGTYKPYNDPARPTQGYFNLDDRAELEGDISVLTNHIRNSYLLSFTSTSAEPGLHAIRVSLPHHPEMVVSARTSYWAGETNK